MSFFSFFADLRGLTKQAKRIADAMDRAYPIPRPEDTAAAELVDVSYASDEATALEELRAEARRLGILDDEVAEGELSPEEAKDVLAKGD